VASVRVSIKELQEGCILSEDIFCRTNRPIIPKKTVLDNSRIEVLKAFLIQNVDVEKTLISGMPFIPLHVIEEQPKTEKQTITYSFHDLFLQSVLLFKKEFQSWQSGLNIDIGKVRALLLPLLDKMDSNPSEIFSLYHFSTKEDYLFHHSVAVAIISGYIGQRLGYQKGDIVQVAMAGCLADCGMAKIKPGIINKKSSLTQFEYEEVKKHPIYSYRMVESVQVLRKETKASILMHHERLDRSGYPFGEADAKIPEYAKIIAVADVFHAMTSERLYRSKQSPFKVLEMILEDNFGQFDINILKELQAGILNFSAGSQVRLSDGREAEILFIDMKQPTRPIVRIIETDELYPLDRNRRIFIEEIL
jgi:HD-GYP domain-containing protein (c-di-GMP phosphodiesterase class II)